MRTLQTMAALVLVAVCSAAYGQAPPLDQTRPDVVAKAYLEALAAGDLAAVQRCLDPATGGRALPKLMEQAVPREPPLDQILTEMLLLPASRQVQYAPGELVQDGDTARLKLVATVSLPQTLVLRRGPDGKWVVDLNQSAIASTGRPEPILLRSIEQSEPIECINNLKQLALAVLMWTQDHAGTLPPAKDWANELKPYFSDLKVCCRCPAEPHLECGYAYNLDVAGKKLAQIERPAQTVLFYESTLGKLDAADRGESQPRPGRHGGANNLAYVDGHVMRQPPQP